VLAAFVLFILVFSFGLHSLQISHEHPGHVHKNGANSHQDEPLTVLGEYTHATEKKMFVFVSAVLPIFALASLLPLWNRFLMLVQILYTQNRRRLKYQTHQTFLELLFSQGLLNPKLH
jgi:hypothetical protein